MPRTIAKRRAIQTLENLGLKSIVRRAGLRIKSLGLPIVTPVVHRRVEHDRDAFTQGLIYENGALFESTGLQQGSSLRQIDPETGAIVKLIPVEDTWAEGIALLGNRLIQLTYKDERAFIYSLPDLGRIGEFRYEGEGWGLASQSDGVWMSNGSDVLTFRDTAFEPQKSLSVTINGRPVDRLNDLVVARGRIFANVLFERCLYELDPCSGKAIRIIDCAALARQSNPMNLANFMNGIAYDSEKNTFYLTGKNWPYLFEVIIPE